ncbi:hypothetical protein [Amycolatopsis methanolica]|uniref:hypothetical protein n=1 Tax=Amycolatopsis methanolica TaxID=1814 RepID=UPI000378F046|nr:hypothetical protein [Amycolatopsis methanolica]
MSPSASARARASLSSVVRPARRSSSNPPWCLPYEGITFLLDYAMQVQGLGRTFEDHRDTCPVPHGFGQQEPRPPFRAEPHLDGGPLLGRRIRLLPSRSLRPLGEQGRGRPACRAEGEDTPVEVFQNQRLTDELGRLGDDVRG